MTIFVICVGSSLLSKATDVTITYILQYEIPLRMNFLDLGHDLLF